MITDAVSMIEAHNLWFAAERFIVLSLDQNRRDEHLAWVGTLAVRLGLLQRAPGHRQFDVELVELHRIAWHPLLDAAAVDRERSVAGLVDHRQLEVIVEDLAAEGHARVTTELLTHRAARRNLHVRSWTESQSSRAPGFRPRGILVCRAEQSPPASRGSGACPDYGGGD